MSCKTTPRVKTESGKEIEAPLYTEIKKIVGPFLALDVYNNAVSEEAKKSPNYSKLELDKYNMPTIESLLEYSDLAEYMDNVYYGNEKAYELFGAKNVAFGDSSKVIQILDKLIQYNNSNKNFNAFLVKNTDSNKYELTVVKKSKYSYDYQNNLEIFADNVKRVDKVMRDAGFSNHDIALQISRAYNVKFVKQLSSSTFNPDAIISNVKELANKKVPAFTIGQILEGNKYKDSPLVGRINNYMDKISDDIYDYLIDNNLISKDKVKREDVYNKQSYRLIARNHMIAMCLVDSFSLRDEKKNAGLRSLVERLTKEMSSMFEKLDKEQLDTEKDKTHSDFEEIKKDVVLSFKSLLKDSDSLKKIAKECKNGADTLQNIISAEMNRMQLANRLGESKQAGKIKARIEKLTMMYEAGTFNSAFINFLHEETKEISDMYQEMVKSMNEDKLNKKTYNVRNVIRVCGYYKNCISYFNSYMSASSSYKEELGNEIKNFYVEANRLNNKIVSPDEIDISTTKAIDEKIKKIDDLLNSLADKNISDEAINVYNNTRAMLVSYRNILENPIITNTELSKFSRTVDSVLEEAQRNAIDLTSDFLEQVEDDEARKIPWGKNKGKEISIKDELKRMQNDINMYDLYLDAMADCPDKILRLTDKAIKVAKTNIREDATDLMRQIKKEAMILQSSGVKDFSWMYKRNKDGKKTTNYISPNDENFDTLVNTEAKRRFYDFFMKTKHEIDRYYPNNDGNYQIIAIRKDRLERLKNSKGIKDFGRQLWEGEKDKWINREDEDDITGYSEMFTDISGNEIKMQPIYYNKVSEETADSMSEDAVSTLIAYAFKGIQYHTMASLINSIELEREVLKNRQIPVTDGVLKVIDIFNKKKFKDDKDGMEDNVLTKVDNGTSNVYKMFDRHMDMKLYGKFKDNEPNIGKLSFSKTVDRLNQKAAVAALSLNLLNGISNVTTGVSLTRIESICGLYFNPKDLAWADMTYFKNQPEYLAEKGNRIKDSKLHLFIEQFDVMQEFDNDINNVDWIKDTWFKRIINSEFMSVIQNAGEHYLNTRVALALAHSIKLINSKGEEKNLWEAFDVEYLQEDGTYGKTNKKLGARLKLNDKYTTKDGSEFTFDNDSIHKISRKMAGINQGIHGIYNKQDANIIQTFAIGRLLYQFRKWMPKAYDKRFANLKYNYDVADWTEGYYQTFARFIYNLIKERNGMCLEIVTRWHELDKRQRANCVRAMSEITQFFILVGLNTYFFGKHHEGEPKPEHSWTYNMLYYQMIRLQSELAALMPLSFIGSKDNMVTEFLRMFENPMAALTPVSDCVKLTQLFMPSSYTEDIKQGQWAGHSKAFGIFWGNKFFFPFGVIPYKNLKPEHYIGYYLNN